MDAKLASGQLKRCRRCLERKKDSGEPTCVVCLCICVSTLAWVYEARHLWDSHTNPTLKPTYFASYSIFRSTSVTVTLARASFRTSAPVISPPSSPSPSFANLYVFCWLYHLSRPSSSFKEFLPSFNVHSKGILSGIYVRRMFLKCLEIFFLIERSDIYEKILHLLPLNSSKEFIVNFFFHRIRQRICCLMQ